MQRTLTLYGLHKCSTCQKSVKSLENAHFTVNFIDVRATPISREQYQQWFDLLGDKLCNRASMTWRNLDEQERLQSPIDLLIKHPSLMKRPLIVDQDTVFLGWTKSVQQHF